VPCNVQKVENLSFMVTCSGADISLLILGSSNEAGSSVMTKKMLMIHVKMTTMVIIKCT
jgi:hypothetical protein